MFLPPFISVSFRNEDEVLTSRIASEALSGERYVPSIFGIGKMPRRESYSLKSRFI
jgi:hypothetical protein